MLLSFTLVAPDFDTLQQALSPALEAVAAAGRPVKATDQLGESATDIFVEADGAEPLRAAAKSYLGRQAVDFCVQPADGRRKRLLLADMDSTIIGCECLDELADFAGVRTEVAAITASAMAGEIGFEAALAQRVAMLEGLPLASLQAAFDDRVRLNPGARTLVATMGGCGARCVLISGGFDFFTARVAAAAGFHAHRANRLVDDGERLTGRVVEPVLGRQAKLSALRESAADMGIDMAQTLAIGDGANDVAMIEAAGLGVAYRAKPILADAADARIDHTDLRSLLFFQGYGAETFLP